MSEFENIMSMTETQLPLPPIELRWGGPRYRDDGEYIRSGVMNVRRLEAQCELSKESRVLDVGCGPGRLLTGIIHHLGGIRRYVGMDVYEPAIEWLQNNVAPETPSASFHHLAFHNARYNPKGSARTVALPKPEEFDCIVLFSVFSHMVLNDIGLYLPFLKSVLAPAGKIYLTVFVEDGVEPETENPTDYHRDWKGPLHCVRLNRQVFEALLAENQLQVERFEYRHTNDGQSSYVLGHHGKKFTARVVNS
ncbi:methyltransferase domain-containing protein [bacterium]|nr:methyltransferase domain-containing protein [bacterium]